MSGISVALPDQWSAIGNQAGNAWNSGIFAGVYFENRFIIKELSYESLFISACMKPGAFSVSFTHSGTGIYSELQTGLGYARKFGKWFSAGIRLKYLLLRIGDGYGSKNMFNCDIGLMFRPSKQVSIGFSCINPVPVRISEFTGETQCTLFQLGLAYFFSDDLLLSAEVSKGPVGKVCARIGTEFRFAKVLSARAGLATAPFRLSIGAGIVIQRCSVDIASEYNQVLGFSPAISVQYRFGKQENNIRKQ